MRFLSQSALSLCALLIFSCPLVAFAADEKTPDDPPTVESQIADAEAKAKAADKKAEDAGENAAAATQAA